MFLQELRHQYLKLSKTDAIDITHVQLLPTFGVPSFGANCTSQLMATQQVQIGLVDWYPSLHLRDEPT